MFVFPPPYRFLFSELRPRGDSIPLFDVLVDDDWNG
jgi:hypothetical protein